MNIEIKISKLRLLIIPSIYMVLGLLWISLSDNLLFSLASSLSLSQSEIELFGKIKGYFYVIITSILLYILIKITTKSIISSKNDFKRLFKENPNPMWIYEIESCKILIVNNAACKQYAYTEEEFLRLDLHDLRIHKDYKETIKGIVEQENSHIDSRILHHKDKLGNLFYVHLFSHDIIYDKKICYIVTILNVNNEILTEIERKNIQKALDNSALVSITNLQGNIIEVNAKFCEVSQYTENELIGNNHRLINSEYHSKEFWESMWRQIHLGKSWRADVRNKAKDGSYYWVDTVINPVFNSEGNIYKFMSVRYEITQRKELEEKLRVKNRKLSEIAWIQSHEVRSPVANILGLCNLIKEDHEASVEDKLKYIDYLQKAANELDCVIRKIVGKTN